MTMHRILLLSAAVAGVAPTVDAQQRPAPRPLGPVVGTLAGVVGTPTQLRALPGGRVLVNDPARRQVVMLDTTMAGAKVVADSTPATGMAYGGRFGGIIPYKGDSTLFVDPQSLAMLMIGPDGALGRTLSLPNAQEAAFLAGAQSISGLDAQGRIVYRTSGFNFRGFRPPTPNANGAMPNQIALPEPPDSAPVQRISLTTRKVDTVAFIKIPKTKVQVTQNEGRVSISTQVNPLPQVDDWAVLPNGDIALVRGRDYHVDWIRADGTTESSPKIAFNWRRMSDEEKVAFIDSVKAQRARMQPPQGQPAAPGAGGQQVIAGGPGMGGPPPGAMAAMAGGMAMTMSIDMRGGGGPPAGAQIGTGGGGGGGGGPQFQMNAPQVSFVEPSELPDYLPPFAAGAVRAAPDGTLWVRLSLPTPAGTGPLYDIIDAKGALVETVQLPAGRTLLGVGADGSVYLSKRETDGSTTLERARLK